MPLGDEEQLLNLVPEDGTTIGNAALKRRFDDLRGSDSSPDEYTALRDALVARGVLAKGAGRGGSVRRSASAMPQSLVQHVATAAALHDLAKAGESFSLALSAPESAESVSRGASPKRTLTPSANSASQRGRSPAAAPQVLSYRHADRRRNNPEVGMVTPDTDPDARRTTWAYDPHLDPALQFDPARAGIETLIDDALASGDADVMRAALAELKRRQAPYLAWAGKAERTSFEVDTVSLHVHERIDPASILAAVRKQADERARDKAAGATGGRGPRAMQSELFAAPFENLPLRDAIDFYKHDKGWSNRLIAGDSLLVMNSLLKKEGMAGQVQMIYIDPPYGIRYGSNFQPFVGKRDVKDRADEDLTQEPETIKAFRDTWELGLHSYLTYLRDRLLLARELLTESGSVFVQISDENVHHVRELMDEVFGPRNSCGQVHFRKTGGLSSRLLASVGDYLLWYAKDVNAVKFRPVFVEKRPGNPGATCCIPDEYLLQGRRPYLFGRAVLREVMASFFASESTPC
jgi:adenine-specific DNA-methyltransferase